MGNQNGMALIITMWLLFVLATLALGISVLARTETHIVRNYGDKINCKWAARAGVNAAVADIESLIESQDKYLYLGEDKYVIDSNDIDIDLGDFEFEYVITDELGKVNINYADIQVLKKLFGDDEIASSVVDWRDSDDSVIEDGAESAYYSKLEYPYQCRNGDFLTVEELGLVKGLTKESLSESFTENGSSINDLVTVYKQDETDDEDNEDKIDIGEADSETLLQELGEVLTQQDIDSIISYRNNSEFTSVPQIINVPGLPRAKIQQIYDRLTVSDAEPSEGKINLNTATTDVLTLMFGSNDDIANSVIEYRNEHGAFKSIGDLLSISDVTDEAFANFAPDFTLRSSVFKIISKGRQKDGNASLTAVYIVDLSSGSPQIKYRKE